MGLLASSAVLLNCAAEAGRKSKRIEIVTEAARKFLDVSGNERRGSAGVAERGSRGVASD